MNQLDEEVEMNAIRKQAEQSRLEARSTTKRNADYSDARRRWLDVLSHCLEELSVLDIAITEKAPDFLSAANREDPYAALLVRTALLKYELEKKRNELRSWIEALGTEPASSH